MKALPPEHDSGGLRYATVPSMPTVHLSLGSNLGDRLANLEEAVQRLRAEPHVRVLQVSSIYETSPVGAQYADHPPFLNAAASISTNLAPLPLLRLLMNIEHDLGRMSASRTSPRPVDLDILFYEDVVLDEEQLCLPHPRLHTRAFVLIPLAEIADDVFHPTQRRTVRELLEELQAQEDSASTQQVQLAFGQQPFRKRDLLGLRSLVTGSSSGIGQAIAQAFADNASEVIVHGRNPAKVNDTLRLLERYGFSTASILADLASPVECAQLIDQSWGNGLDVLVCNAGADTLTGDMAKASFEEKLDYLLQVDLKATLQLCRAIGSKMKKRGRGVILTIGWDQCETGMEGDSGQLFAAVKGAITCFTRSLALSLAPEVRVNCIAPGWIRTAWGEGASPEWQNRVKQETPMKIWGLPKDVANAAVWLASPKSKFITGQTIRINGGVVRL